MDLIFQRADKEKVSDMILQQFKSCIQRFKEDGDIFKDGIALRSYNPRENLQPASNYDAYAQVCHSILAIYHANV